MITKCFLDASVIADWLILKLALELKNKKEKNKLLLERKKDNLNLFYAYNLLEKIKKNSIKKFKFFTSDLAISEVISVIHEKFCIDKMYERGTPLKYWYKYRDEYKLNEPELKKLTKEISTFYSSFIKLKKINLTSNPTLQETIKLISLHWETHDSFLISQAVKTKVKYFISKDNRLKESLKNYKKIKICNPQYFFTSILKNPLYSSLFIKKI